MFAFSIEFTKFTFLSVNVTLKMALKVVLIIIVHTNLVFINLSATFSRVSVFAEFSLMHPCYSNYRF